ncbi:MAG: DUF1345 domain-containing protein [Burkholderiales bacterium]
MKYISAPSTTQISPASSLHWTIRLRALHRLLIAIFIAVLVVGALQITTMDLTARLLAGWDVGALVYLALAWLLVSKSDTNATRIRAQTQDQNGFVIFLIVITAAMASIVAIGFTMQGVKEMSLLPKALHLTLTIIALISSWLLIQTVFAFHYARKYYGLGKKTTRQSGGLLFPGDQPPDYLDFIYYAHVVGMTSQVSDVVITSRHMRRQTLVHSVLAFVFNMAILALSINIIAGAF